MNVRRRLRRKAADLGRPYRRRRRSPFWRLLDLPVAAVLITAAIWLVGHLPPEEGTARVIDGDTLILNGKRIRLKGIDAPELHQTCRRADNRPWLCGRRARAALRALIRGKRLSCRAVDHDRYGRTVAYCRILADDDRKGEDVGLALIKKGLAIARPDAPLSYRLAERRARQARIGLWQGPFLDPATWRKVCSGKGHCPG